MAGFFGLFDYSKPGKGISKNEPQDNRFVLFFKLVMRKFWKLIQLNLIYLLFCIPVVTIGPATAALCYVLRQFANEQPVFLFSDFWDNFKSNFKQSIIYGFFALLFGLIMIFSIQFYYTNQTQYSWMIAPLGLCLMIAIVAIMANFYIYPMIVTLDLKLVAIVKNGLLLAILCIKNNLITLAVLAVLIFLLIAYFPITIFAYLLLAFSLLWFIVVYNAWPGIKRYAIDPFLQAQEEEPEDDQTESLFADESE